MRSAVIAKSRSSTFSFLKQRSPSFIEAKKNDYSVKIEPLIYPKDVEDEREITDDLLLEGCEAGKHVTEAEYWDEYHIHPDFRYEYNDGILELKPMPDFAVSEIDFFTCDILREFIKVYPIAIVVNVDVGFTLKLPNKTSVRKPDIGIILKSNPVQLERREKTYAGCFDFCIELLSHSSKKVRMNDIVVKKLEYSQFGVKEYYIIDEYGKDTAFYRLNAKGQYETIPEVNGIIESTVLPGFRFRVSDLYTQPDLLTLINDEVYSHYVLMYHQKVKQEAQEAKQEAQEAQKRESIKAQELLKANQEAQEAKQELLKAKQLIKKLKLSFKHKA